MYSFYVPVAWALRKLPHIYHVSHRKLTKPTSLPFFLRDVIQPQQDTKAYLFLCMIGYCFYLLFLHYTGLGNFSLKDFPQFSMFVSVQNYLQQIHVFPKACVPLGTSKNQHALDHMLPQQIFLSLNLCIVQVLAHLFYFPSSEISFLIFLSQRLGL